jgi:hypothetical protein
MNTVIAAEVNPYAGLHPVTASPAEMEAVRRATGAAIRETPYYVERYGERAALFGGSDGGWLVTLCDGDSEYIERQVLWLGRVLSARGVPRILLQRYLRLLRDELAATEPQAGARCTALLHAGAVLAAQQRRYIPDPDALALADGFDLRADEATLARLPGMGRILIGAVADEAGGIAGAMASVAEWATDPGRFPDRWITAVNATVAEARGRVRRTG